MRSRKAIVTAFLTVLSLAGGGSVAVATVGTAMVDARNIAQPRFHATARCQDGTWSWAKNPDAPDACAHHGGVTR